MISVRVHGVGMSPYNQGFVALLMDDVNNEWLPIYIGSFEAQAIAMELDDVDPPRPMTHDLLAKIIDRMDVVVDKIVVSALKESTYYAEITLKRENDDDDEEDDEMIIDARPSDSIALALRTDADIFVADDVMEEASVPANPDEEESEESKKLKILQHRLQRAVEEENFEEAAELRDKIREVQKEIRQEEEAEDELDEDVEEQLAEELGMEEEETEEFQEVGYSDFEEFEEKLEEFEEGQDPADEPEDIEDEDDEDDDK
ncbi:MAG: bifunctional nuclease family protein [bacterium]